jgi:HlyD family secretion protein
MDRELDTGFLRRRTVRRGLVIAGLAVAAVALFFGLPRWLRPSVDRATLRTGAVDRGPVEGIVEASGTVAPAFEKVLSSPVEARVVRVLKRPGERVEPGEEILELDVSSSRLELDRLTDLLTRKESEAEELRLDLESELADLSGRIERGRLDAEILRYRLEQNRKLYDDGLLAEEALRLAEVEAEKADIELAQLEAARERAGRVHAARLQGVDIDLRILAGQRAAARRELELANTRSDRAGVVTWVVPEEGATVRRGEVVARIADLDSFRVEATVSDVHASRLAAGLPVRVVLGELRLDGRLASVDPTIENGVVRFAADLDQPSHPDLRNNLRVDVLVVTGRRADTLRLPRGSFAETGGRATLFVVRGDHAVRRPVELGLSGYRHLEVTGGLAEGETVILSDMSDFLHLDRVEID